MSLILKQSTAVDVLIGPFVDATDGYTSEDALTLTPALTKLSKNGQALATRNDVTNCVNDDFGYYNCELDATDTNTVGTLVIAVEGSATHLAVRHEFQVVEENVYDAMYGASAALGTDVASILTDTGTTLQAELDAIQAAVITNAAGADIAADIIAVKAETASILTDTGTTLDAAIAVIDANVDQIEAAVITNAAGVDIAADIIAMKAETALIVADTNELQTDDVPGLIAALNDPTAVAIADAVWDEALAGHVAAGSYGKAVADIETDATAILADSNELQTDWADGGRLDVILDAASAPSAAAVADAVWDEALAGHVAAGSYGKAVADIETDATAILADSNELQTDWADGGRLDVILDAASAPTAAAVADAVWDEALAGHVAAGSYGKSVADIETDATAILADTNELQGDWVDGGRLDLILDAASAPTAAAVADAVWDEAQVDHVAAGSFGLIASEIATIDTVVDGIQTDLDNGTDGLGAIKADTAAILVDTGTTLDGKIDTIDGIVDAILVDTGTTLDAALAVVDANVDAILVDTGTTLDAAIAVIDANVDQIETAVITNAAGVDISADVAAMKVDTAAILVDTNELQTDDIPTSIAALPTAAENADAIWDEARSGHSTQGTYGESHGSVISANVNDGSPTTTVFIADLTETTDDHYIGRVIIFTSGTLLGQATDITDYTGATKTLTVTALTEAPANGDDFIII